MQLPFYRRYELVQEETYQLQVSFFVRLVTHGHIKPAIFLYDALFMTEGIKALFPMIGAHTAVAHAAESHFGSSQMDNGIINASATERDLL